MRLRRIFPLAVLLVPAALAAQTDSLGAGDRVRVTINAPMRNSNVFIGTVSRLTPDTIVVSFRDGRASMALPRITVDRIETSAGQQSRLRALLRVSPLIVTGLITATLPTPPRDPQGRHDTSLNTLRYMTLGLSAVTVVHAIARTQPERWVPHFGWLDR